MTTTIPFDGKNHCARLFDASFGTLTGTATIADLPETTHSRISQLLETPAYSIEARDLDDPDEDESRNILDTTSLRKP